MYHCATHSFTNLSLLQRELEQMDAKVNSPGPAEGLKNVYYIIALAPFFFGD